MICPACFSDSFISRIISIRDGKPGRTKAAEILKCKICGLERLGLSDFKTSDYYASGQYDREVKQPTNWPDYVAHLSMLLKLYPGVFDGAAERTMIDAGSGNGEWGRLLNGLAHVHNLDYVGKALPVTADLVTSFNVVEHTENPIQYLQACRDMAEKGLFICTPNTDYIQMEHESFRQFFYRVQHNWYFNAKTLSMVLRNAGFESIRVGYYEPYGLNNRIVTAHQYSQTINEAYKHYLIQEGKAYYLYAFAS